MQFDIAQVVNKGMQRDYAMNTASQEFAYENKNIRITSTGNESFLSVTNERSTIKNSVLIDYLQTYDVILDYKYNVDNIYVEDLTITFNFYNCTAEKEEPLKKDTTFRIYDNFEGSKEYEEIVIPKGVTTFTITGWDIQNLHFEKGVKVIQIDNKELYNMADDVPIGMGTVLGVATIGEYVIVFSKYEDTGEDVIYRLKEFDTDVWLAETVFRGDLNFDINHPIECTTLYESKNVQKVYWVDGINQPRVINIMELGQTSNTSNLDFVPKIEKQPVVTIEKEQNGAGLFPSGVVQYYITYYKKFNQETHIAYTSPLYYISPDDKGGEADSIQTCSFKIRITDIDPKYDYARVYSLVRTSKNSDYVVSIVGDLNIKNSNDIYQIIDTNTNLVNVPSTDILFLGGNVIIPSTIEQKDNTLFLGNITTGTNIISDEIEALKKYFREIEHGHYIEMYNLLKFVYKVVPVKNEDNTTLYPYNPNLESNLYDTHFKLREKYRVGIQLINGVGESSQTIYIGDIINENHYPHYMSQDVMNDFSFDYNNLKKVDNHYIDKSGNIHLYDILDETSSYSDYLCLPIITFNDLIFKEGNHIESTLLSCKEKGFTNYRLVIAETDYKDRSILCQGYVNPLTFKLDRRKNNTCYSQESWTIRPIGTYKHLKNINRCIKDTDNTLKYSEYSEIRGSLGNQYTENAMIEVEPDTQSSIKTITLDSYSSAYATQAKDFLLYYIITVYGTDAEGNNTSVSFRFDGEWSWNFANCYNYDILPYWHTFDAWTQDKIDAVAKTFGTNAETLNSIGIKVGNRIFGDAALPSYTGAQWPHHGIDYLDYKYKSTSRDINANLDSESLDSVGVYGENFFLDASQASFNTPDLENIQDIIASNPNLKCRIVGKINIDRVTTDYNINLEDTIHGDTATSVYKFDFSKILNIDETVTGIKNFPAVWSSKDSKAYNLMLLDRDGPTIAGTENGNPTIKPSETSPTAVLKNKIIGNLWYASKTDYEFHWRYKQFIKWPDHYVIEYYPETTTEYNTYGEYRGNCTQNADEQKWYSDLIYSELDLNGNVVLWNNDIYNKNNIYLRNIEDVSYNKNWAWMRTTSSVTDYTTLDTIKDHISQTNLVDTQNQIKIKYNASNNILINLKYSYSDLYSLPGYENEELQGTMGYLWSKSAFTIKEIAITALDTINTDNLEPYLKYTVIDGNYPDVFFVKKDLFNDLTFELDKAYYLRVEPAQNYKYPKYNYYNYRIVNYLEPNNDDNNENQDINNYVKFQIVNDDSNYKYPDTEYDGTLYKGSPLFKSDFKYKNTVIKNKYKILGEYNGNIHFASINAIKHPYLFSLKSTLRGPLFLSVNSKDEEEYNYIINEGFYPNKEAKHYLPFNLKGLKGFDYPGVTKYNYEDKDPEIDPKSNGINNSLWICELYKDFDDFEFLGGTSENAIELNTFIPASQVCPIGSTIYGLYGDTYFKRWDNLRVYPMNEEQTNGIVDVVSLMLETHVNLDGDTRSARKRLDITNMRPSNMEGLVNPVYSQSNNVITSNVLDDKFNVSSHPLQYWWSLPKTNLSEIDNWTQVNLTSVGELDGDKGSLNKIKRWNNYLFAFQDKGIAQINFNNQTVIGGQEGIPVEIANSGKVQGHYYITTNNGCKNKWSIVESPAGLYFIDSYNKSIMLLGDGLKSLSQLNLFQDWIEKNEQGNIWNPIRVSNKPAFKSFYDPIHSEVYFANGEHCLCYNELLQQFTSFYDYENLNYMFLLDGHIYGVNNSNSLHKMFEGYHYCNLFGKQCEYYMQYKINKDPFIDKTWTNIEYRADIFESGIIGHKDANLSTPLKTFDKFEVWNEYQYGVSNMSKAKCKFRIWREQIPRDTREDTRGFNRIRNPWIMLKLEKTKDTDKRMEFHDLLIKYLR